MPSMMKAPHSKGMNCPMCSGGSCRYAEGGEVEHHSPAGGSANRAKAAQRVRREEHVSGVHKSSSVYEPGSSRAGYNARAGGRGEGKVFNEQAKGEHQKVRAEQRSTPGPTSGRSGFAHGGMAERKGETTKWKGDHSSSTGVNAPLPTRDTAGWHGDSESEAGVALRHGRPNAAKGLHRDTLDEMRSMKGKDRKNLADGGEVDADGDYDGDIDVDMELSHGLGKELMSAFESKDHKAVMSALEACVLHCMNKDEGESDV